MNDSTAVVLRALGETQQQLATLLVHLRESVGDTEPVPHAIVLLRTSAGRYHRACRVDGRPGLMTYERCNLDQTDAEMIDDLSKLSDESDLCDNCFGVLDGEEDFGAYDAQRRADLMDADE